MNDSPTSQTPEEASAAPAEPTPAPETPAAPSPGALVRQARERAGLAADELATQIKLSRNTLDALERDDFASLSEPVYVRGYYRKIAKMLPVSEAELLAAYGARATPAKARPAPQRIPLAGGVDAGATRRTHGQGIGLAVAVVVAAGLLFLLADKNSSSRATKPAPAAPVAPAPAPILPVSEAPASAAPPLITAEQTPAAAPGGQSTAVLNQLVLVFSESSFVRVEDSHNKT
ncbi:MAG: helix-turn-helix domain-containing protein, partial [Hydrocarboniphaga effusa]|nr:helix-turn-helix domain-containing protein [Hydrocarboniphaga effusa]